MTPVGKPKTVSPQAGSDSGERLEQVAQRHGVRLLLAFGSQATGRTHSASDLDLAVLVDPAERSDWLDLMADLQEVFPGREVDLAWLNRADPLFAWRIFAHAELLFGDPADFAARKAYAWRRYVEYAPFLALERTAVRRRLAEYRDAD
jgi:predicted nucleotidyltransferase